MTLEATMQLAIDGDSKAYNTVLKELTSWLRIILKSRLSLPEAQQEDVLQETLIAIHKYRHTWQPDKPLKPWAFSIAKHKTMDYYRKHYRRSEILTAPDDVTFSQLETNTLEKETTARMTVEKATADLTTQQQDMLRMAYGEGHSLKEVAAHTGQSEGAVKVSLHRLRAKIRKAVGDHD